MSQELIGKKVAILATDGVEQSELTGPRQALEQAGAKTFLVSPADGQLKAWKDKDWGETFPVDVPLSSAKAADYDALVLPGGVINPDKLRVLSEAVQFVRDFNESGKTIGAICHGPWTLIEAGAVEGKNVTSWPSLESDLSNAGAHWSDAQVVTDKGLVTSRKPDDIPAFSQKLIEEIAEGVHAR